MKKSLSPLILTLLLIATAFICMKTNPTYEQYTTWVKEDYIPSTTEENKITEVFAQIVGPTLISQSTITKNYVFFTLYEVHLEQDNTLKVLGVLNNFFVLEDGSTMQ